MMNSEFWGLTFYPIEAIRAGFLTDDRLDLATNILALKKHAIDAASATVAAHTASNIYKHLHPPVKRVLR